VHNKTSHASTQTLYYFHRKTLEQEPHSHKQNTNNCAHFRCLQSEWFGSVLRKYARTRRMLAPWPTSKSACYKQDMLLFWYRVEFDRSKGLKSSFFFSLPSKSLQQTPRWPRGIIYTLLPIFWVIKSRKTRWVGRVRIKREKRNSYRFLVGKPEGKR